MHRHQPDAVAPLLEDRRLGGARLLGLVAQPLDEAAERQPASRLVLARQLADVLNVGERLLARGRSAKIACARDASSSAAIVAATGRWLRRRCRSRNSRSAAATSSSGVGMSDTPGSLNLPPAGHIGIPPGVPPGSSSRCFFGSFRPEAPGRETGGRIWRARGRPAARRRRTRTARRGACRRPTARRPATRSRRARCAASRPPRARGSSCRRRAGAASRAPRAPGRRAASRRSSARRTTACRSAGTAGTRRAPQSGRARSAARDRSPSSRST